MSHTDRGILPRVGNMYCTTPTASAEMIPWSCVCPTSASNAASCSSSDFEMPSRGPVYGYFPEPGVNAGMSRLSVSVSFFWYFFGN